MQVLARSEMILRPGYTAEEISPLVGTRWKYLFVYPNVCSSFRSGGTGPPLKVNIRCTCVTAGQ